MEYIKKSIYLDVDTMERAKQLAQLDSRSLCNYLQLLLQQTVKNKYRLLKLDNLNNIENNTK